MHRELIKAYFTSGKEMLKVGGEIHVTHRNDYPYNNRWKVKKIGKQAGLDLKEKVEFLQANYPGYHNKRGSNINCNKKFPLRDFYTFKFTLKMKSLGVKLAMKTQKVQAVIQIALLLKRRQRNFCDLSRDEYLLI